MWVTWNTGDVLPDVYSGTFSYNGGELQAQGMRFVFQRKLSNDLIATIDYAYGGVLELAQPAINWSQVSNSLQPGWRHTAALKLNGIDPPLPRPAGLLPIAGPAARP